MPDHTTESVLRSAAFLPVEELDRIYHDTVEQTVLAARRALRNVKLTVRDLLPSDLGEANEVWAGQTGATANVYENTIIASQTIADETFVGIYGVVDTSTVQSYAALRWTVGGRVVAQWSLFNIISEDTGLKARTGIAMTPIVISQNTTVLVEGYVRAASQSVELALLGVVVEKAGKTVEA